NNLIRVNKYFADAHKTTKDKLAGKNCFDIYPKDEAQKYLDDDESTCKTLAFIFNKKGYNVETVGTGHEALEIVRNKSFNLALLDIKLPDVEGIELLLPLKKMHPDMETMMTPIVLLKP
ncbi:MAG: response regulator, partial [Candidatus Lokiarchaeota archaeon]|nr:response regulator [Candidatus Lokiarchaeota archaeon]